MIYSTNYLYRQRKEAETQWSKKEQNAVSTQSTAVMFFCPSTIM